MTPPCDVPVAVVRKRPDHVVPEVSVKPVFLNLLKHIWCQDGVGEIGHYCHEEQASTDCPGRQHVLYPEHGWDLQVVEERQRSAQRSLMFMCRRISWDTIRG